MREITMNKNHKLQITNSRQITNSKLQMLANLGKPRIQEKNKYNLEDRTLEFSKKAIVLCKKIPRDLTNIEIVSQLVKSACSIGANYREANENLGKKDFVYRIRISRKEAKECCYWLELLLDSNDKFMQDIKWLLGEAKELRNIFSAIISKSS